MMLLPCGKTLVHWHSWRFEIGNSQLEKIDFYTTCKLPAVRPIRLLFASWKNLGFLIDKYEAKDYIVREVALAVK
jgi:hypothetical protein